MSTTKHTFEITFQRNDFIEIQSMKLFSKEIMNFSTRNDTKDDSIDFLVT